MKIRHVLPAAALAALLLASAPAGATGGPVIRLKDRSFGPILATPGHQALYFWSVERKAGFRVRCTGACAKLWPPLVVRSASTVREHVPGVKGTFGVVRRPDGRLQVTYDRRPVYTYAHEAPNQVLCNDVDGWFVVRV